MALPVDSKARKGIPIVSGVLDYFPDALAYIAKVSKAGNDKHNPGEPLNWSRGKSGDHADCIGRHLLERGTLDPDDGLRHSGKLAWRALALLQLELEAAENDRSVVPRAVTALDLLAAHPEPGLVVPVVSSEVESRRIPELPEVDE